MRLYSYRYLIRKHNGMTENQYSEMMSKQNGQCSICKKPPLKRRLAVDHNHDTGKVRGLLCDKCNLGLGYFNDNVELLTKALDYLVTHSQGSVPPST